MGGAAVSKLHSIHKSSRRSSDNEIEAEMSAAVGNFKSHMEARVVEQLVKKLTPRVYINSGRAKSEDVATARTTWALITTDSSPGFLRQKKDASFQYPDCISKLQYENKCDEIRG